MVVGIIGAGASGMAAALTASLNPNVQVLIFERQARVGRKLQATGNGRCNLSNIHADRCGYHGDDPGFAEYALHRFDTENTLSWFRDMGLYTVTEESGRVYPYSDQANSVVDVLRLAMHRENIQLLTGFEVQKIRAEDRGFTVTDGAESYFCDKLIVACGGLAGTKLGGSMSGYKLLAKLGHKSTRLRPALVQLKTSWGGITGLKGVRANCHVQILRDGDQFSQSTGELQFTEYGISGPVMFEVSRDVCHGTGNWTAVLDFLPDMSHEELTAELRRRTQTNLHIDELFTGILHNRLGRVLTKAARVSAVEQISQLSAYEIRMAVNTVKGFEIPVTEPLGMDSAQVTAGGVLTTQFDPTTMESKLVPGLYACGEVLDIDGDCGGYNLQWAWSSGRLAGLCAGEVEA